MLKLFDIYYIVFVWNADAKIQVMIFECTIGYRFKSLFIITNTSTRIKPRQQTWRHSSFTVMYCWNSVIQDLIATRNEGGIISKVVIVLFQHHAFLVGFVLIDL
jgi:hypothetical protein